ncbi:MAG: hypothetical protein K2X81_12505, partial [Candidatus Obscuribacterales bacterium]|nr:hypothetical protein [Candidatus Obscuribacterales bacterium]
MSDKIDISLDTKASGKAAETETAKSALSSEFIASMPGKASSAPKEITPPPNIPFPRPEPWPNPWPNPWPQDPCAPDGI